MKIDLSDYSFDREENLNPEDFVEKYSNEIKSGEINDQIIKDAIFCVMDVPNGNIHEYKFHISMIYTAILYMKYYKGSDVGLIHRIFQSICYLKTNWTFSSDFNLFLKGGHHFYDIESICRDVYDEIKLANDTNNPSDLTEKMPLCSFDNEEELDPKHLLDLEYHLNNFRKWTSGGEEFIKILDKELWRYI